MRLRRAFVSFIGVALLAAMSGCGHEQRDWHAAQAADTTEAYDQFVKEHPTSALATQAKARLAQLTEDHDWQLASTTNTADAYRQFIADHPQSKSVQEAHIRIENFGLSSTAAAPAPDAGTAAAAPPASSAVPAQLPSASHKSKHAAVASESSADGYRIQLGAFSTRAKAQAQWQKLSSRFEKELGGLTPEVDEGRGAHGRRVYRLRTKLASDARARSVCAALEKHAQHCIVARPAKA